MKLWKDMTNEEKGALLLAHHEGAIIEYLSNSGKGWVPVFDNSPRWGNNECYRIQLQTTTHQVWWSPSGATIYKPCSPDRYNQLITFTLKGDECIDVKVEEL